MAGTIAAKSDASTTLGNLYYETGPGATGIVLGSKIFWGAADSPAQVTSSAGLPVAQQGSWTVGVSGTVTTTVSGTVAATQSGTWTVTASGTVAATQSGTWSTRTQDGSGNAITSSARGSDRLLHAHTATNARRDAGTAHRSAITSADKLAAPGTITLTGLTGGSLTSGTTYYVSAAAYNSWGATTPASVVSASPGGSNTALNVAFAAVSGADGYDLFLSTDAAAPKWVARITAAQMAAGGYTVTAVGTVTQTGSAAAASVDIRVVGTGVQSTANPFTANNAYKVTTPTYVDCTGYSRAHVLVKLAVTDLRSAPTLTIVPFFKNQLSGSDYFAGLPQTVSLMTAVGQPLMQDFQFDVDGSTGFAVLIDTISGQGASASVWVELS